MARRGKKRGRFLRAVKKLFVAEAGEEGQARAARRAELSKSLPDDELSRVTRLDERRQYILELAAENRNLASDLLEDELDKLHDMVDAFLDLACSSARWERHLKSADWEEMESDTRRHEHDAKSALDPEHRALARKNLEVLLKRREQLEDLRRKVARARAQLDLIESTFQMLANQVLLMSHPRELGGKLDELRAGVEAVVETTRGDTDASDPSALG